jgi:hypothetical protein
MVYSSLVFGIAEKSWRLNGVNGHRGQGFRNPLQGMGKDAPLAVASLSGGADE